MQPDDKNCYEIILNYNCNARCLFCSQGSFDRSLNAGFDRIARNIYTAYKSGYRRLGFTGGEPLLRPDMLKIVSLGKSVGFKFIRVQTNGIKLADVSFTGALVKAGLTFCKFSFLSDSAKEHDRLVGVKGAWQKAMSGLENLKSLKIRLGNNIVVNRFNYKRLPEIIHFFLKQGISNFVVIYPLYEGAMAVNAGNLGVSLKDAGKYLLKSLAFMKKANLHEEILFLNVPPCFLKGSESLAIGLGHYNTVVVEPLGRKVDLDFDSNRNKVFGKSCMGCDFRGKCGGVNQDYIKFWGWKGFSPAKKQAISTIKERTESAGEKEFSGTGKIFFSDNEKCVIEILADGKILSTSEILKSAKNIPLCRDCADGNAVVNACEKLVQRKMLERIFKGGVYYWKLITAVDSG